MSNNIQPVLLPDQFATDVNARLQRFWPNFGL